MIEYSVIIRTTGNAGEKYQRLLDSIEKLEPQPFEIIVVLPNGVSKPLGKGNETYYFCEKGMINQRVHGIKKCKTKYALICDDDISFGKDFVQKLHEPIEKGLCSFSSAPLLDFLPPIGIQSLFYTLTGAACKSYFHRERYITVLSTTGYSYNRNIDISHKKYMEAQSLPWTCFYANINDMEKVKIEDEEIWLNKKGYASMDDQVMFYKAYLMGLKTFIVTDASYTHLDARTSRQSLKSNLNVSYSMEFNRYVFWHRFIFQRDKLLKKIWDIICINYYFVMKKFYNLFRLFSGKLDKKTYSIKKKALKNAKNYVHSEEYEKLPSF